MAEVLGFPINTVVKCMVDVVGEDLVLNLRFPNVRTTGVLGLGRAEALTRKDLRDLIGLAVAVGERFTCLLGERLASVH